MAQVLRLSATGLTDVDLLGGVLRLRTGTWVLRTPNMAGELKSSAYGATWTFKQLEPVTETYELIGRGTSDELRDGLVALDALLEQARRWHSDALNTAAVWLNMRDAWEAYPRRALVFNGQLVINSTPATTPLLDATTVTAQLTLTRHPLWELGAYNGETYAPLSALGGAIATGAAEGTAPGRIIAAYLSAAGSGVLTKFWLGLRSPGAGTSGFVGRWECESGTPGTDAALWKDVGDDASPSDVPTANKVRVGLGYPGDTTTLAKRLSIMVGDVITADYDHMIGRYVVLLRCKVAAGAAGVQLRWGNNQATDATFAINETTYIENTAWQLINLGEVQIPPVGTRVDYVYRDLSIEFTEFQLWAEQVDAACVWLDFDCLILIPAEHYAAGAGLTIEQAAYSVGYIYTTENDLQIGVAMSNVNSARRVITDLTLRDWYYPVDGAFAVVAAERDGVSVLSDTVRLTLSICPRFRSYSQNFYHG